MRNACSTAVAALLLSSSSLLLGQAPQSLSISNYLIASQQPVTATQLSITFRADLINPGQALPLVKATVTSLTPNVQVAAGQDTLHFWPVPAHTQVSSNDTFTVLVDRTVPFDYSSFKWTFEVGSPVAPVAHAGPDQRAIVGRPVTLDGSASTNPSNAGTLTYSWAFSSVPAGSTATLANPNSVMPAFVPDVAGNYIVTLTVNNGFASASASTKVSTTSAPIPVANAGPTQIVTLNATVVLNGSASTSGNGNPLTYYWTMLSVPPGSTATLSDAHAVAPAFVVDKAGSYVAQLIVNDGAADSLPSQVTISTISVKPVANAGPDQVVNVNSTVQLNGSGSTDANGLALTYQWSLISVPTGSAAVVSDASAVNPTFIDDRPGTFIAQLIVNNGLLASLPDTVLITTNPVAAPTANAGANKTIRQGDTVQLSGSGTDPQNLPLTFQWTLINKPAGSSAILSSTAIANPAFVADLTGDYIAQLIVNNGFLSSAPVTVTFSTTCAQAAANAGPNQNVAVGATVTLDGSASGDVCHDPLTYSWSLLSRPNGSTATLSGANVVSPTLVTDVLGTYVAQLIVNNGLTNSIPATVTITAGDTGLVLPSSVTVPVGESVPLSISLPSPAPAGGIFISLTSSDPSKVTITPANILIQQGQATSSPPKLNGLSFGSARITASAPGLSPVVTNVQVTSGVLTFLPPSVAIDTALPQYFTLALTPPSPASVIIALTSSDPGVATVPATIVIPANASSVIVPVTIVGNGSAIIHASSATLAATTAKVDVIATGRIALLHNIRMTLFQPVDFPIMLSAPPVADLTVTLVSSDPTKVMVTASVVVPKGQTTPAVQPQVTGIAAGIVNISVSAPGYIPATESVQALGDLSFAGPLSLKVGATGNLTLRLGGQAPPNGLVFALASSNPGVASVPATVIMQGGMSTVDVPVTALTLGSSTITAILGTVKISAGVIVANLVPPPCPTCLNVGNVSVGKNLQTQVRILLPGDRVATENLTVRVTSSDPSKVLLGADGKSQALVTILQGTTTGFVLIQGLDNTGTATLRATATGVDSGSGVITLTPSAFVLAGPNGIGKPFSIGLGAQAPLTVSAARLDAAMNFVENQQVRTGAPVVVNLSSSTPSAGTATPASVTFTGGDTSADVQFRSSNTGSTTLTASAPAGFSTPGNGANSVTATVVTQSLMPSNATVGQGLETTAKVTFNGETTTQLSITVTSGDPDKLLLSATPNGAGSTSIVLLVPPGHGSSQEFYVYGLGKSGTVQYTATAPGFGGGTGTVTLAPSGLVIGGPGGIGSTNFLTTPQVGDTPIIVSSALLNQANGFVETQALAGSGSVSVTIISSNPSVGTIATSPVTLSAGSGKATTLFHPLAKGTTTLSVNTPAGFTMPSDNTSITAQVVDQSMSITDGVTIGKNLETVAFVTLPAPAASNLAITFTSSNPSLLKLSPTATGAGSASIILNVPAGSSSAQYWLHSLGSSGATPYTSSAPGYVSRTATVRLAPSGVSISGPLGVSIISGQSYPDTVHLADGPSPLTVTAGVLDGEGRFLSAQPVSGSFGSLVVPLTNRDTSVGTVPAQATVTPGNDSAIVSFTPLKVGATDVSVETPAGFAESRQYTSVRVSVVP